MMNTTNNNGIELGRRVRTTRETCNVFAGVVGTVVDVLPNGLVTLHIGRHAIATVEEAALTAAPVVSRKVKIEFCTDDYEFSHGKPRGRGSWAFALDRHVDSCSPEIFWSPGGTTYGEAKKMARAHFAAKVQADGGGSIYVWVLS